MNLTSLLQGRVNIKIPEDLWCLHLKGNTQRKEGEFGEMNWMDISGIKNQLGDLLWKTI
jgi:hypothetical protein